jgi:hypothetical protein
MASTVTSTEEGKTSTLRLLFITFSGKKEDWEQWNNKTLSLCRRGKYGRGLTTNLAAIYASETDDDKKEKLAKVNADTYDHLMLSLNSTEFGIVSNAISKEFPKEMQMLHGNSSSTNLSLQKRKI